MIIRKLFTIESSHIVRNCSTSHCKFNIHGHSYKIEVLLKGRQLDNGGMIVDFGLLKKSIKEFINSFDHCHVMWSKDNPDYIEACRKFSDRTITMPMNPSAECLAITMFTVINEMIKSTTFQNGEKFELHSVIVHETATGYAQAFYEDAYERSPIDGAGDRMRHGWKLHDLQFSDAAIAGWSPDLWDWWFTGRPMKMDPVELQVEVEKSE